MSIEDLDTKKALMAFIVEQLEAEPLPMSAIAGLQSAIESSKWTAITLINGFTNLGGIWSTAAWRTLPGGLVQLKGTITRATEIGGAVILAQPLPVHPLKDTLLIPTAVNGSTAAWVSFDPGGSLTFQGPTPLGPGTLVSLDNILFANGS